MARLHAFGCSHTFGQGITKQDWPPDMLSKTINPSKYSWAAKLAKSINFELINHAVPGSSNHGILNQVKKATDPNFPHVEFINREPLPQLKANSGDIAAILFTYYNRSIYYTNDGSCDQILIPDPNIFTNWKKKSKSFFKLFGEHHVEQISLYDIEHTYLYLKNMNIPFIAMFIHPISSTHKSSVIKQMVLDADYPIHNIVYKEFRHKQRFGADGDHWSTLIHIEIAKLAEQKIQPLITAL